MAGILPAMDAQRSKQMNPEKMDFTELKFPGRVYP
jgi:hypothetical protein